VARQTPEAKKARRDANTWWKAKASEVKHILDEPVTSAYDWREWEDDE